MTAEKDDAGGRRNEYILEQLETFFALPYQIADELTPGHGITLAPGVFLSQNRRFTWPHAAEIDMGGNGFCRALHDHVAILVDGTVVPCCFDAEGDIKLGNIYRQPLDEIVTNPRAMAIRQGFLRKRVIEQLCRRCSYRQRFAASAPGT
jgi:radical SAM protein with 4Fe4S-binding SPASM domain